MWDLQGNASAPRAFGSAYQFVQWLGLTSIQQYQLYATDALMHAASEGLRADVIERLRLMARGSAGERSHTRPRGYQSRVWLPFSLAASRSSFMAASRLRWLRLVERRIS